MPKMSASFGGFMSISEAKSRWQKFKLSDVVCLFYWGAFAVSFCIIFNGPIDFSSEFGLTNGARKFCALFGFWIGTIVVLQSLYGFLGSFKKVWKFCLSPLVAVQVLSGFWIDTISLFGRVKKQLPTATIFFSGIVIIQILSWTEIDPLLLKVLLPLNWLMLIWLIVTCFRWALDPLPAVGEMKFSDKNIHLKAKAVAAMATVKVKNAEEGKSQILKTLSNFTEMVKGLDKILSFFHSPKLLFFIFMFIFFFAAGGVMFFVGSILRIEHLLTPGGVFSGAGFSGTMSDYLYIVMSQYFSADMFSIAPHSQDVRYILVMIPFFSAVISILLILAFTMFFQTKMDKTAKDAKETALGIITEAAKSLVADPRVVLEAPKESKPMAGANLVVESKNLNKVQSENVDTSSL